MRLLNSNLSGSRLDQFKYEWFRRLFLLDDQHSLLLQSLPFLHGDGR
jgi:hypothetical protein